MVGRLPGLPPRRANYGLRADARLSDGCRRRAVILGAGVRCSLRRAPPGPPASAPIARRARWPRPARAGLRRRSRWPPSACAASPPIATSRMPTPRSPRTPRAPRCGPSPPSRAGAPGGAQPVPAGRLLAAAVLAGQQAVGQREVGDQAHAEVRQRRDQLRLGGRLRASTGSAPRRTGAGPPSPPSSARRRSARPQVRAADVPDLALGDQLGQRREGLLDRRHRVGLVQLVEVDVVGAEPAQARLDRAPDVAARRAGAPSGPLAPPMSMPNLVASTTSSRRCRGPGRAAPRWRRRRRCPRCRTA